jgi:nucleoside-diphosphate-sugar epimerase
MHEQSSGHTGNRILVTGASGFVGRSLCNHLVSQGFQVRGTLLAWESAKALADGVVPVVVEPLQGETEWGDALNGVDTVIHLAARVHIMSDPSADPLLEFTRVNCDGTSRLAREAVKAGVRRLVFVSSVKVHGEEAAKPYTEESPASPTDPYGISKWQAEQALREVESRSSLQVVVLRPTLVYGPGVKANFLNMMKVIHYGTPLPLASVRNRRSLIYLGNLVDALATCATHPGAAGKTFLVSDGEDLSTPELLRLTASALGTSARLFHFSTSLMQLTGKLTGKSPQMSRLTGSLAVDSSRIRTELGWRPPFSIEQGLKATAQWFLATQGGSA